MMKAQTKRILYRIFLLVCGLAVVTGTVLIACNAIEFVRGGETGYYWAFGVAIVFLVFFPVNTIVHEAGHLVFGYLAGMKFSSIRFSWFRLMRIGKKVRGRLLRGKEVAGSCEMYPKNAKNVRARMIFYALGGATFNLIYGVAFVVTCFVVPLNPALYFFQLFASCHYYPSRFFCRYFRTFRPMRPFLKLSEFSSRKSHFFAPRRN